MYKLIPVLLLSLNVHAASAPETWSVDGKTFDTKAMAVRYIVASGKRSEVLHSRCEILTNKLSFKACPKNKLGNFENEQFQGLKVSP